MEASKRQTRAAYGWLVAGQSVGTQAVYAHSVCDTKAPLQLRYAACGAIPVLYACMPLPFASAGNNWGRDANGATCIGCGAQEEFYGCADIAIVNTTTQPSPHSAVSRPAVGRAVVTSTGPPTSMSAPITRLVLPPIGSAETTTLPTAGLASKQSAAGQSRASTTAVPLSALLTQDSQQQVIQFNEQPYNVVVHSSVFSLIIQLLSISVLLSFHEPDPQLRHFSKIWGRPDRRAFPCTLEPSPTPGSRPTGTVLSAVDSSPTFIHLTSF